MAVIKSAPGAPGAPGAQGTSSSAGRPTRSSRRVPTAGLQADIADGKAQAAALARTSVPIYFPKMIVSGTSYEPPTPGEYPRAYQLHDPQGVPHASYRIVMAFNANLGQFYGVQGTTWKQAPILASPQEIRYVGGKRLELHFDGHSLRLVAWRTAQAVYWVSNTLSLNLSNQQMLGMAASLTRAG
jgi:hypothetical protein